MRFNFFEKTALCLSLVLGATALANANVYNPFKAGGNIPGCVTSGGIVWNGGCGAAKTDSVGNIFSGSSGSILTNGGFIGAQGATKINFTTNGNATITDIAGTSFNIFQFGGTTSSFPAIKRSGAGLSVRLADDSADASLSALSYTANGIAGVSCTGAPTASFASVNGIVTHC